MHVGVTNGAACGPASAPSFCHPTWRLAYLIGEPPVLWRNAQSLLSHCQGCNLKRGATSWRLGLGEVAYLHDHDL